MEMLHRTKSSSNPDLLSPLSTHHHGQPLKRTNCAADNSSIADAPAPLQSAPSFSIYSDDLSPNELFPEPSTSANQDFTFGFHSEPKQAGISNKRGHNAVPLFLARGLGIDRLGSELLDVAEMMKGKCPVENRNGEEKLELDMVLKRLVDDEPGNANVLRDYAQFLYQVRKSLHIFSLSLSLFLPKKKDSG